LEDEFEDEFETEDRILLSEGWLSSEDAPLAGIKIMPVSLEVIDKESGHYLLIALEQNI